MLHAARSIRANRNQREFGGRWLLRLIVVCRILSRIQFRQHGITGLSRRVARNAMVVGKVLFAHAFQLRRGELPLPDLVSHGCDRRVKFGRSPPTTRCGADPRQRSNSFQLRSALVGRHPFLSAIFSGIALP